MLSVFLCVGIMLQEPKRYYSKKGDEISDFWLYIKRPDLSNNFDLLKFEAFKGVAKWANDTLHKGDTVEVRARPVTKRYINKKTGKKGYTVIFRVAYMRLICHKSKLLLNQFGGDTVPQLNEEEFMYWG